MPINKSNNTLLEQVQNSNLFKDSDKISNNKKLESTIVIKINEDHKKILENHFKNEKGLALSSGIRQIIFEYMKENNLI
ncbi:hypothetical protein JQ824_12825 [Brachyspira hyodysenteriae]|uniref:Uncharacterized protein n=1 Tax=Brachyspira hyodysenteriae ATCC 27164 TaxID=1266923 RepID=A0A3B6WCA6_BRAHO|nr:hypothetical protein [Brachyspira hyodysenteriae]ANN64881.1 hypothetical protein BHYOB78_13315 [Brachyspira hyodysenteriae ATCC 27164]AUJ51060.1 hypothetical protein BH718_p00020 [Brachyspira hyodysenteriae]KLI19203.1 hypothetical protein SU44_01045 [Brachyspira hyodysenteriae]KLI19236.1 hypothetical protein SU45_00485 [Brachyspira hyodysenteriae]KLI25389.1 hypothetical protein SU43_04040 [Brachyspira hyodysenteriae]